VPLDDVRYLGLTFSNDGNFVYYTVVRERDGQFEGALYQVPVLGGAARKLLVDIDTPVALSPDGKRLAFIRARIGERESALIVANSDGTERHVLAKRMLSSGYVRGTRVGFASGLSGPAWSPDGNIIACAAYNDDTDGRYASLVGIRVEDGTESLMSSQRWIMVERFAWLSDSSGLVMVASEQLDEHQIWHLSYPSGALRRITDDPNSYQSLSVTSDSNIVATVQSDVTTVIWMAPALEMNHARQITPGKYDGRHGLAWTPDNRIVYDSLASGNDDIWIMNADGTGQRQLTVNPGADDRPSVSPDGRYIVFGSERGGVFKIWRMSIDGNDQKQLTSGLGVNSQISPDGRWVVYQSHGLWKVSIDGGEPVQLTEIVSAQPTISPDGKFIAFRTGGKVAIIPFEGGETVKTLDIPLEAPGFIRWTPDGHAIAYVETRDGISNIWAKSLDDRPRKQLTDFKADHIFRFEWSRDGKWLAIVRGAMNEDVVLIRNTK